MSRIGNSPIPVKNNIKVEISGKKVQVTGPKGSLNHLIPDNIEVNQSEELLRVSRLNDDRSAKALHGLTRSLLANMIAGVESGFQKILQIHGVGYRAQVNGNNLVLNIGYSHPVEFPIPEGITISVAENTKLTVTGIDKQQVGQVAATIREFKKPEPYKGKGIRYSDEVIQIKEGKTV